MRKKKIVKAKRNNDGIVTAVKFDGNKTFTELNTALNMAKNDKIKNVHVSTSSKNNEYLRSNPNKNKKDNLNNI